MSLPAPGLVCPLRVAAHGACNRKRRSRHNHPKRRSNPLATLCRHSPPSFQRGERAIRKQTKKSLLLTCSSAGGIVCVRWVSEDASSAAAKWPAAASSTCRVPVAQQPTLVWGTTVAAAAGSISLAPRTLPPSPPAASVGVLLLPLLSPWGAPPPVADLCRLCCRRRTSAFGEFPPSPSPFLLPESYGKRAKRDPRRNALATVVPLRSTRTTTPRQPV